MGWGRMLLLGNWGQQMDIEEQRGQINDLQDEISRLRAAGGERDLSERINRLESEIDELRMYVAALIRYLGQKGLMDKAEFSKLVDVIDREDGTAGGGYRGPISQ